MATENAFPSSEFEPFLFAPIGAESNGMNLSVFSALARLDLDPWREAARFSHLSRDLAIAALRRLIDRLPVGAWDSADVGNIAERLVALLPQHGPGAATGSAISAGGRKSRYTTVLWMVCFTLGAAVLFAMTTSGDMLPDDAAGAMSASDGGGLPATDR